jgi:hypothetical protein
MISSPKRVPAWGAAVAAALLLLPLSACGKSPEPAAGTEAAPAAAAPVLRPLPETAYKVGWGKVDLPAALPAGKTVPVKVTFRNDGDQVWPDRATGDPAATGANAVRLSYRFLPAGPTQGEGYLLRADLAQPLPPGQETTVTIDVKLPDQPGDYQLQLDLVQELIAWFEWRGAAQQIVPIKVGPPAP